jgi:MFS family permease
VTPRLRTAALGLAVGLVLADSSVVILALPDIVDQLDVTIPEVAWVLTSFNLVLALTAVPAAYLARRLGAGRVCAVGIVIFAAASAACGLADSLGVLIAARCVQAVGGAAAICAALELLPFETGSERRAATVWAAAGVAGAALGPAIGGLLTQAIAWEAIFLVQAPLALLVLPAAVARSRLQPIGPAGRPDVLANLALGLVSAALAAALFLLVLLLIDAWLLEPIAAAVTVSVMPVAAIVAGRLLDDRAGPAARAAAGAVAIAGGLAALGLLPGAHVGWTIAPQILIGAGLGLTVSALTERALEGRGRQAVHGGWTIAARHAGVVVGLLILTPIFTADLASEEEAAERSGTDLLLRADIPVTTKVGLGTAIMRELDNAGQRLPNLAPAFDRNRPPAASQPAFTRLQEELDEEMRRAGTHAFSRSFLAAALLAALALVPIAVARERIPL